MVLEGELLRRIGEVQDEEGKTAPVLVVVPTARLVDHLHRRLAEKFGALLGIEIVHFHGLAKTILEATGNSLQPVSGRILTELLRRCIGELPDGNRLKRYVSERPGAASALMSSIRDLREAGVDHGDFSRLARSTPDLALLYKIYCHRLDDLANKQITDEAGFITTARKVLDSDPAFRNRFEAVFLYGAYELIGIHLDLLRKLEPVTALAPFDPTGQSPAGAYAERFARGFLMKEGEEAEQVKMSDRTSMVGESLSTLYNEDSRPPALPPDRISLDDFQGAATEVTWAVRRALASGTDPKEICILARDLSRYGPALEEAFRKIPCKENGESVWTSSLHTPLRRDPVVHDALVLLQVVSQDFPRAPTVELLSSPRVRWRLLTENQPDNWAPDGAGADVWSRRAGILGGLHRWQNDLPREAGFVPTWELETEEEQTDAARRAEQNTTCANKIVEALSGLHDRFHENMPDSWSDHAVRFRRMLALLPEQPELSGLLEDMAGLEILGSARPVTAEDALTWFEQVVDDTTLTSMSRDTGGIRVLEVMQARGLTFERVFLVGFHAGAFPRIGREDPFIGDSVRRAVHEELRRPLASGLEGGDEERLLLALMTGAATEHLHVSWQRADDTGRAVSPSAAVRELARIVLGTADTARLLRERVVHRSVHPRSRLEELSEDTGMLDSEEADTWSAFSCEGRIPDPGRAVGLLKLPYRTLAMLQATELFRFGPADWDGRIGRNYTDENSQWSATAMEDLGRCPLRFFFSRILKIEEPEETISPLNVAPKDMGTATHKLLELIYTDLQAEGLFIGGHSESLINRGKELFAVHWDTAFKWLNHRVEDRLRPLWKIRESIWRDAVIRFLETDLAELAGLGSCRMELEDYHHRPVDLGDNVTLQLGGKFDRLICATPGRIADYKTSGNIGKRISVSEMLKGSHLQVPIYHLLAEGGPAVELLGVGPSFEGKSVKDARPRFDGFGREDQREGMLETLRVLAGLLKNGLFPLRDASKSCSYCVYKPGCRVNHPPTLEREAESLDGRDYLELAGKNRDNGKTLLPDLRKSRASE